GERGGRGGGAGGGRGGGGGGGVAVAAPDLRAAAVEPRLRIPTRSIPVPPARVVRRTTSTTTSRSRPEPRPSVLGGVSARAGGWRRASRQRTSARPAAVGAARHGRAARA